MSGAMSDVGDGHNLEVPRVFGPTYPGVVPKALELLAGLFGAGHAMDASFCEEKEGVLTKANAAAVGSSGSAGDASFLEGGARGTLDIGCIRRFTWVLRGFTLFYIGFLRLL